MGMHRELIPALCERGHLDKAVDALARLDVIPSTHSYLCLLKSCTHKRALFQAKQVQAHLSQHNVQLSGLLGDYLVVTLARCGAPDDALIVLYSLPSHTVFSWSAIISAYVDVGDGAEALRLHQCMLQDGVECDHYTYVSLFKACGSVSYLEEGMQLHAEAKKKGFTAHVFVGSTLVSMYGKCNALAEAENVFARLSDCTVVSWNAMLSAYVEQRHGDRALQMFVHMQMAGVSPNYLTYVLALQACLSLVEKEKASSTEESLSKAVVLHIGQSLQADATRKELSSNVFVCNALVNLYSKCGDISKAEHAYAVLPEHSLLCCRALLSAYVDQGHVEKALLFYMEMENLGIVFDHATLTCALQACDLSGNLETCKHLHFSIVSAGYDNILSVAATLIHCYGSCACMSDAQAFFEGLLKLSLVLWNAFIAGHAAEGNSFACLQMLENLCLGAILPDGVTFNSVLCACSHSGLIMEGFKCFVLMKSHYGLARNVKHYGSMLDLLARAGDFKMVESVLQGMKMQVDSSIWLCLLGASRLHGNVELARQAFANAVTLQPKQDTAYVVMASLYSDAGLWQSVEEICGENLDV